MSDEKCCSARVYGGHHGFHYCTKPVTVERNSRWYCTIHDPERIARKWAERQAKWEAGWAEERKRHAWESARNIAVAGLTFEELCQVTPDMIREAIKRSEMRRRIIEAANATSCTPGYPPTPIQAGAQDGDNPTQAKTGEAGDLDRQPAE